MLRLYSKYTHNLLSTSSFFILLLLLSPPSNLHHHLHHHNQREKRDSLLLVEAIAMGQGISTAQWFTYGRRHFTKTGYIRHVKDYRIENGLTNKNQWQQNQKPPQSRPDTPRGVDDDDGINLRGKVGPHVLSILYILVSLCDRTIIDFVPNNQIRLKITMLERSWSSLVRILDWDMN